MLFHYSNAGTVVVVIVWWLQLL